MRAETVVNSPTDFGVQRRLHYPAELVEKPKEPTDACSSSSAPVRAVPSRPIFGKRISQPSREEGQRTGALRFGDQRAKALAGALCVALNTVVGFTNKSLRVFVSQLLDGSYNTNQMTYDLRRLRLKGLVTRVEHTNTYTMSESGIRFSVTYTKLGHRVPSPLLAADHPPAPIELRRASGVIDHHVEEYLDRARLRMPA
jgi:hypothetical protein